MRADGNKQFDAAIFRDFPFRERGNFMLQLDSLFFVSNPALLARIEFW